MDVKAKDFLRMYEYYYLVERIAILGEHLASGKYSCDDAVKYISTLLNMEGYLDE